MKTYNIYLIFLIVSFSAFAQNKRYNEVSLKASHNSYAKKVSIWDQLTTHNFQSIEFDLHTKKWLKNAPNGDWHVYHHLFDRKSQIKYLSDGLDTIAKFNKENPSHEALTVFMDMSGFNKKHSVAMLDKLLSQKLGDIIYSPEKLKESCPDTNLLTESVLKCGWPLTSKLRGKIIFVLTKGDLKDYVEKSVNPMAFVASKPNMKIHDSVFMNIAYNKEVDVQELQRKKIITRFYFVDNKEELIDSQKKKVNFIAIDQVDSIKDPWQDNTK